LWREFTGQTEDEVQGWGWIEGLHPDDREHTAAVWSQAVANRSLYETEYRMRRRDGHYRHMAVRGVPVLEQDGSIREWVGTCTDIHDRKLIEDELRKQAALLSLAHDAIIVSDLQYRITFWNRGAEETYGWTAKEAVGRIAPELLQTEFPISLHEIRAVLNQQGEWEGELKHRTRDGRSIVVASRWSVQRDHHGNPLNILEINRDITDRKRAEEELRLNRERLILAQKVGGSGTFDWDIRNNVNTWMPETEELYGLPAGGFGGTFEAWERLVWPADLEQARPALADSLKTGEFQGEWRIIRPSDGQMRWLAARAKVLFDEDGQPSRMIGINIDITERKRLEDSLRQRTLELENSVAELEAFSYSVSHDLRAPLRSIDGFSQILLEDYRDKVDAEGQDSLRRIRNASQNMGQLIDALLQLSRVMRSELRREPVDLSVLALSTAAMIQKSDPARPVRFHVANGLQAHGDRRLLGVVLQNLLQNAWKFSGRNPEPLIEVGSMDKNGKIAYYVRDNGIGFDMAYVGKLFTPFQRLHAKEQFEGTGIGLATVQRVIKRHGGKVWAEAAVGKGATFYFSLD
jgi:PAS domain S-box-containing protein